MTGIQKWTEVTVVDFKGKLIICSKWLQWVKHWNGGSINILHLSLLSLLFFSGFFDLISEGTDVEIERNTEENFQG